MTQDPRLRRENSAATYPWNTKPSPQARTPSPIEVRHELTDVARTLAAYGGQAVAFDLALDLVLNGVVERARSETGATGAAIALSRDGAMECRATTGQDAPDLGVRLETESGLSGACLRSGEVQHCSDTESDGRVDAEACRQLGVRSMLIVPLIEGTNPFGILEVFSSRPNAFSERDVQTLELLAQRIAESRREAERGHELVSVEEDPHAQAPVADDANAPISTDEPRQPIDESVEQPSRSGLWTTMLVFLVVAVAVVIGVLIGWRGAAKKWLTESEIRSKPVLVHPSSPATQDPASVDAARSATLAQPSKLPVDRAAASPVAAPLAPTGGLLVTQNGKVIYRESSTGGAAAPTKGTSDEPTSRIIRRVDPEYPADARSQHIQGPVVLDVQVLSDGTVGTIGIVSGDPLLTGAAVHAVRQWKYQPNVVNGRPVEGQTRITIHFTLPPAN